jgi:hypothetical protein
MNSTDPHARKLSRRSFSRLLAATAAFAFSKSGFAQAQAGTDPSMMLGARDAFSGLDILRVRFAAGHRPSDDITGNALSWLLSGQKEFGEKCIAALRTSTLPEPASRSWPTYAGHALAFDWLYRFPAFDEALKDKVARQLLDGAIKMASTPDLAHPEESSYHNYKTLFLWLTAFSLCTVAKYRPQEPRVHELRE